MKHHSTRINILSLATIAVSSFSIFLVNQNKISSPAPQVYAATSSEVLVVTPTPASPYPPYQWGFAEHEPNNMFIGQVRENGYISLKSGVSYSGKYDGNTSNGNDGYFIYHGGGVPYTRTFTLLSPVTTGNAQLVLWKHSSTGAEAVAQDQTYPFQITYTFNSPIAQDYQIQINRPPTANDTSAYSILITDPNIGGSCPWSAPISSSILPGSGTLQTAGSYVIGSTLFQTIWRGDQGWARSVPIVNNVPVFAQASPWSGPSSNAVLGGTGIQTETEYVIGDKLYQGVWRNTQGYSRTVPIVDGLPQYQCGPLI